MALYAHTPNEAQQWHLLEDHLRATAQLARSFAEPMGSEAAEMAYYAGLWHDLGKCGSRFQHYLSDQALGTGKKGEGGDHKHAGAVHAAEAYPLLALLVAGHHGGLPSLTEVRRDLPGWANDPQVREARATAAAEMADLARQPERLASPGYLRDPRQAELFLRLLYSCLVDADSLDTESHTSASQAARRAAPAPLIDQLWQRFSADQEKLIAGAANTPVNLVRERVYRAAIEAATGDPGFFRLTVPTGGGKTRTALGFGLRHAVEHVLRRVVFAVPYTTITEQTAGVYRRIFDEESGTVLEHHSAVVSDEGSERQSPVEVWRRLAAENWDAPIVVTTTVQLFESLLGNGRTPSRKLHNLLGSVVVLDEAQTLPGHLLTPLLDVLAELVRAYRVTVVFCTATQPPFHAIDGLRPLAAAREIAPDPPSLFDRLARVSYRFPAATETATWDEVAARLRGAAQALAIVNTRRDALALLDALDDLEALHLSTLLCGAHRRDVLEVVRGRLARGERCRLIATQVVEAGVDLNFPLVLRAVGPLDAIVQAAGRCNREGQLRGLGEVVVFQPADGHLPPGDYRVRTQQARTVLADLRAPLEHPASIERYYRLLFQAIDTDREQVQACRAALDYPETAQRSRLIVDDSTPVVVPYRGLDGSETRVDALLAELRRAPQRVRSLQRALQPYVVNLRRREAEGALAALHEEVVPGLGIRVWRGAYDARVRGLGMEPAFDPEALVV